MVPKGPGSTLASTSNQAHKLACCVVVFSQSLLLGLLIMLATWRTHLQTGLLVLPGTHSYCLSSLPHPNLAQQTRNSFLKVAAQFRMPMHVWARLAHLNPKDQPSLRKSARRMES